MTHVVKKICDDRDSFEVRMWDAVHLDIRLHLNEPDVWVRGTWWSGDAIHASLSALIHKHWSRLGG